MLSLILSRNNIMKKIIASLVGIGLIASVNDKAQEVGSN